MTSCQVLHCQNPGSAIITSESDHDLVEKYICADHDQQIKDGALWDVAADGSHAVVGQDGAPTLKCWEVRDSKGSKGFTLTLETSATGDAKPFEVFLTPDNVKQLNMILASRGE